MSDKERDELATVIAAARLRIWGEGETELCPEDNDLASEVIAAGYRKPRTVTEADIARAAKAHYELDPMCLMVDPGTIPWERLGGGWKAPHYSAVKTILAAIEPAQ